jgi:hypothetical protein
MTWTLLRKELRQHWWAFLIVGALSAFGYLMILGATITQGQAGSSLVGLRGFILLIGTIAALVICHRLVVAEYQAKTQLFLEALPLLRRQMVIIKYCLGLAVITLIVSLAFSLACLLAWHHQMLSLRFLGILAARTFSFIWLAHSFFFLMGLMGRYRLAIYIGLVFGVMMLVQNTVLDMSRFGPFSLLDKSFAYESEAFPWNDMIVTWSLSLACMLLAFGLSLCREGSVAALLAEKMSYREKIVVAVLLLSLAFAGTILDKKEKKTPFDLQDAAVETRAGIIVKVASSGDKNDTAAPRLARRVANELSAAREYLGMEQLPAVFITSRRDLDANRYERGELKRGEGVHVRANFYAKEWRDDHFLMWLMREVLIAATDSRVKLESRRWVLDGFALFWPSRRHVQAPLEDDKALALRALYGIENGFTSQDMQHWLIFTERVGDDIAAGVAWSGIRSLARRQGEERCRRFIQAVLAAGDPKDIRALFKSEPLNSLLQQHAGESLDTFFEQWQKDLAAIRPALAKDFAKLPRLRGQVDSLPLSFDSRKVRFRVGMEPLPAAAARYSLLYCRLPAFDEEVSPLSIERMQNSYARRSEDELPGSFSRGTRLYWTFSFEAPELGCPVISGWRREELR